MEHFMPKELVLKMAFSYTDADFREVVDDYVNGECFSYICFCYKCPSYICKEAAQAKVPAGKFQGVEKMITSRIALDDVVSKGFEALVTNKDDHVKIMVTPKKECLSA
jgi:hypothetical protein